MKIPAHEPARDDMVAPGYYRARLVSAESTTSRAGNPMVRCTYQIVSQRARGAELTDYVAFTERTWWKIDQVSKALRVKLKAGEDVSCDQFAERLFEASRSGREVVIRVEREESEEFGPAAKIRKTLALTEAQEKDGPVAPDLPAEAPEPEQAAGGDDDDIPF